MNGLKRLIAAKRGAVAVEFILAFMPMATAFMCFTQIGFVWTAHLVFRHAAFSAGRAAITTVEGCNPGAAEDKRKPEDVRIAARNALGMNAWQDAFGNVQATPNYGGGQKYGPVRTTTTGRYKCTVPLGKRIVCPGGGINMTETVTLPHQGASYDGAGCGE